MSAQDTACFLFIFRQMFISFVDPLNWVQFETGNIAEDFSETKSNFMFSFADGPIKMMKNVNHQKMIESEREVDRNHPN